MMISIIFLVDLCEKELKKKKGKSLDFYDTSNLIDQALKQWEKKEKNESEDKLNSNKLKKVTFKEEKEVLEEEEDENDDQKEEDEKEESNGQTRLEKLEKRMDDVEEAIKDGI